MKHLFILLFCGLVFIVSCDKGSSTGETSKKEDPSEKPKTGGDNNNNQVKTVTKTLTGIAEKGPFIKDSKVTIQELDKDLSADGNTYSIRVVSNSGGFSFVDKQFKSEIISASVEGYFMNEVKNVFTAVKHTLESISFIKTNNIININLFTHLEKKRVEYLVLKQKMSLEQAKLKAVKEVFASFGKTLSGDVFADDLNIAQGGQVGYDMAVISAIVLSNKTEDQIKAFLTDYRVDLEKDGVINTDNVKGLIDKELKSFITLNSIGEANRINDLKQNLKKIYTTLNFDKLEDHFEGYAQERIDYLAFVKAVNAFVDQLGTPNVINDADKLYKSNKAEVPFNGFRMTTPKKYNGQRSHTKTSLTAPIKAPLYNTLKLSYTEKKEYNTTNNAQHYTSTNSLVRYSYVCRTFKLWSNGLNTCEALTADKTTAPLDPVTNKQVAFWDAISISFSELLFVNDVLQDPFLPNEKVAPYRQGDKIQIAVNPYHNLVFTRTLFSFKVNNSEKERVDYVPSKRIVPRNYFRSGEVIKIPIIISNEKFSIAKEYRVTMGETPYVTNSTLY